MVWGEDGGGDGGRRTSEERAGEGWLNIALYGHFALLSVTLLSLFSKTGELELLDL